MPLPRQVQTLSGKMIDADTSQGRMSEQAARDRAAKTAAATSAATAATSAFSADSSVLSKISDNVSHISSGVEVLVQGQRAMLMIAEADARRSSLDAADIKDPVPGMTTGVGMGPGPGAGESTDADTVSAASGLGGLGGMIAGLGAGIAVFGTMKAKVGVPVFLALLTGLIAIGFVGAKAFEHSVGGIVDGMEKLSKAEIDSEKVIQIGKALAAFGLAMAAEGLGAGIGGLGTLVGGIADGFAGFLGIEGKDPIEAMKKFAKHEISEKEVKQIVLNAKALTAFSGAMAVSAGADFATSVANLATGVVDFAASFFPKGEDPMEEMIKFANHKITQTQVDQIKLNAAALVGFSTVMAVVKTINIAENLAEFASGIVLFASSFFPKGKDPMIEMKKFAEHKFTEDEVAQIMLNSKALLAFAPTMAIAKATGAAGDITAMFGGIANGLSSLFGLDKSDPMAEMKLFAKEKITQAEADQISLNATALVNFSKAMALYKASGAAADSLQLVGNMAKGISNFFGGTTGIDYEESKTFAASDIGTLEPKITANAKSLSTFALAMKDMAGDSAGVEFKNIGTNLLAGIGNFFGGDANTNMQKNITAIEKFTETQLDHTEIDNNISAIEKFLAFGQSMVGFKGGDLSGVSDFAESLVASAHGIKYALHGGDDKYGVPGMFNDIKIKPGQGLASVGLMEMTEASLGVAVLRHSLTNDAPLQELRAVQAEMNASNGGLTIVNAPVDNSISSSRAGDSYIADLSANHDESTLQMMFMQQQGMVGLK